jgi:uncharacterized protein (TIGR00251 family)
MATFVHEGRHGLVLTVHVVTRAARNQVVGVHGQALKIRLQAPPADGAANAALLEFVAALLGLPTRQVEILSGHTSRDKTLSIRGLDKAAVENRLEEILRQ